ncbi:MAG: hypothetical protein GXP53_09230 [Deltaproteobacteria bacterium]|nr:hypothetical protein [Deltaproteobacteria bacterium]
MDCVTRRFNWKTGTLCALLLAGIFLVCGCRAVSDFSRAYDAASIEWRHPDDNYGRKVVIMANPPISIPAGFMPGHKFSEMFAARISAVLKKDCAKMIAVIPADKAVAGAELDPFLLCERFRKSGANAVLVCGVESITPVSRTKSFWRGINPFGRSRRKALEEKFPFAFKVRARLTAWSTLTAARIYDQTLEKTFDPAYASGDGKGLPGWIPGFGPVMAELCEKPSKPVCKAVFNQVWTAYITKKSPDGLIISAGLKAGLSAGTALDVWSKGDMIKSADGNRFIIPGEKIGSVKVISVSADTAVVSLVSGKPPVVGSVVSEQSLIL